MLIIYLKNFYNFILLHKELIKIIIFNVVWFSVLLGQLFFLDLIFVLVILQKLLFSKLVQMFLIILNSERVSFKNALLVPFVEESFFILNFIFFCSILGSITLQFLNPNKFYLELLCVLGFLSFLFRFIFLVFIQIKTRKSTIVAFLLIFFRFEQYILINLIIIYYIFWFNFFNGKFDWIIIYLDKLFYSL